MRKTISICLLMLLTAVIAGAQIATGTIHDDTGNPLHYVFINDAQYKTAALSDSAGNFTIPVHPDSKLQFNLTGYSDASLSPGTKLTGISVVLKSQGGASATAGSLSAKMTIERRENLSTLGIGGAIVPGHQKGDLRGSMYLFDKFTPGFTADASGNIVYNPGYFYDYDKVKGGLLFTKDEKTVEQASWDQVRSFTIYSPTDQRFDFTEVPAIDQSHYVQVLASGARYKIYKLIETKFVKSDYVNTGLTQHGNNYDEYVDDADYYFVDGQGAPVKFSLKKKALKELFAKEADKAGKYMSAASGGIDDAYLAKLGEYMNQ